MFKSIEIRDWRQFSAVRVQFHDRLTILTGANGSGKTTILNLLNRHFGWNLQLVGTPRAPRRGVLRFFSDLWKYRTSPLDVRGSTGEAIGSIVYSDGASAALTIPHEVSNQYQVDIADQRSIAGIFIPSHRPVYVYQQVENIPTTIRPNDQLLQNYLNEVRSRFTANSRVRSPSHRIKEALISLATFGYGNQVVARNDDAIATFEGFQKVLSQVLPSTLGFQRISIRMPEVVLETTTGEFSLDSVSGGISAIIDMAWQIYMASIVHPRFVVAIDEPENHLHPTLQKTLLPNFISAFANTQFIVATHNPFMVGSVPESNVYVLDYNDEEISRVVGTKLDLINKAASSSEILREVLGVRHTKPIWVEQKLELLIEKYSSRAFSDTVLRELRDDMRELQLDHLFPETVSRVKQ